jgi:hypothetical protein
VLLAPNAAQASEQASIAGGKPSLQCYCLAFAQQFVRSRGMQRRFRWHMTRQHHVSAAKARKVTRAIYDYERRGDFKSRFCKRHPKVCNAAWECAIFGGLAVGVGLADDGALNRAEWMGVVAACSGAAAARLKRPWE